MKRGFVYSMHEHMDLCMKRCMKRCKTCINMCILHQHLHLCIRASQVLQPVLHIAVRMHVRFCSATT